jgi:UDP-N-acetylglucosamine--N-acetylmuramyl-(pentapeptide) pyrophosphoryl-undecaprenol N-acetylglucosamine transferase
VLLKQDATLAERLAMALRNLLLDSGKRLFMAEAARSLAKPDAAERVVDAVLEVAAQQETRA